MICINCDTTNENAITEKTYPDASNFKKVTLNALNNDISVSDSVNIDLFVTEIFECPKNAECIVPDRIYLSESLTMRDTLVLFANMPSQFNLNAQYLFSVDVRVLEEDNSKVLSLLGYSDLN